MLALETIASRVKNRLRAKVLLRDYSRSLMTQKSILKFSPRDRVESVSRTSITSTNLLPGCI